MTLANAARRLNSPGVLPSLLLVTDEHRRPDPLPLIARLPPGSGVLLRHYGDPNRSELALSVAKLARRRRLIMLVAGADWRLAARVGAHGIHLGEAVMASGRLAPLRLWARKHGKMLSGASHGPAALAQARRLKLDGALLSPVFATASHPGTPVIGPTRFALWARRAGLPVLALGGIDLRSARALRNAAGLAAIGGFEPHK